MNRKIKKQKMLCSACLLGIRCRYDGKRRVYKKVLALAKKVDMIPVCPEQLGGLSTPRKPSEQKASKVITDDGEDVTINYRREASQALQLAKLFGVKNAIMKQRSPSCGCGQIYDGSFSSKVVKGDGITTKLLKRNGIRVITEEDI